MHLFRISPTFESWQERAREALSLQLDPPSVAWQESTGSEPLLDLFEAHSPGKLPAQTPRVPKSFLESARLVALHSKDDRWHLLYQILWRLTHGESRLLENPADADTIALTHYEKEVSKDAYRMTAFVRFREVPVSGGSRFVAWYEPEHNTVELNGDFFSKRFANSDWSILTPKRCMHWDGVELWFTEGVDKSVAPRADDMEAMWITYYSRIFNPARLKVRAMQAQLLKRNWKNLPEAVVIEPLIRHAAGRVHTMMQTSELIREEIEVSSPAIPPGADLPKLREAAASCRACPLWKHATCTVFGEGRVNAEVVLVGEQPGDQEDRSGVPFVGPAGQVLDRALAAAGIDRSIAYVTNAVKHFKFEPRGKRRIHKTANSREIAACRPWLVAELELIQPKLVIALGGTASEALFGRRLKISDHRGSVIENTLGQKTLVTVHPSSLLRLPPGIDPEEQFVAFANDLRKAADLLG